MYCCCESSLWLPAWPRRNGGHLFNVRRIFFRATELKRAALDSPLSPPRQALQLRTILRALAGFRKLDLHLRTIMYLLECTQLIPSVPQGTLVPRLVHSMTAQNDRLPISNARRGLASTPRAWSIETGQCSGTRPPPGAVSPVQKARSEGRALKHERSGVEGLSSVLVTSQ